MGKLEVDINVIVAKQYGTRSIPTLLFFKDGQLVDHVVGVAPKKELTNKLKALLKQGKAIYRNESMKNKVVKMYST